MKKNLLFCSMFIASVVCAEEFQAQKFTWQLVVEAKDSSNLDTLSEFNGKLRSLINEMNENSTRSASNDVYQKFLIFIKDMQEAIVAGLNLFSSVATAQEPLVLLAEEVVGQIEEQAAQEQAAQEPAVEEPAVAESAVVEEVSKGAEAEVAQVSEETAPAVRPAIVITFVCGITDASQEEVWNTAINLMQALADKINHNDITPDDFVTALTEIYNTLAQLPNSGLGLTAY